MSWGSRRPSPSASTPTTVQVEGMNCIGPTARSNRCVTVEQAGVGVVDARGRAATGEPRAEDRRVDDAVGGHQRAAEPAVVALDLADRGDQLPGEVAGRVGLAHHGLGPLVGRQRASGDRVDRGEPRVGDHAEPGAVASRLLGDRCGRLDSVGQLGHGRDRRDRRRRRPGRRARDRAGAWVGAHQADGGGHRERREDGDQAERDGGRQPAPNVRFLASPVSPEVARAAAAPTAARQVTSRPQPAHQGVCPSVPPIRLSPSRHCDRIVTRASGALPVLCAHDWHPVHTTHRRIGVSDC